MALDQITRALVDEYLDSSDTTSSGVESDFERFCTHVLISSHTDSVIDYENVLTGDGGDTGIDAVGIIINDELVTDPDVVDQLADDNVTLDVAYVFIQAKTSASFSTSEVGQIGFGVQDFFEFQPTLDRNDAVQAAAELSGKVMANARLFRNGNPSCKVFYATAGRWMDDPDVSGRVKSVEDDLDGLRLFSSVSFTPVDARGLQRRYHGLQTGIEREFTFQNRVAFPDIEHVAESHLGFIPASELLDVITADDGTLASTVFYDNVRDFQGESNAVNAGMRSTLQGGDRSLFPLMNNGVTVIAKGVRQTGIKFVIRDFQIVNGCQTCNVLWANKGYLDDDVLVPLRLISTENEDAIVQIIRATNRQTEVKDEQFFATSDYLKQLESHFASAPEPRRLHLERRSKQYANSSVERTRVVPFNSLVRSFTSVVLEEPHRATRNYKQVLARIPDDVLNPTHKPSVYFASASSLYRLEFLFRNGVVDRRMSPAKYHLLLATRLMIDSSVPRFLNGRDAERWATKLITAYWSQRRAEELFLEATRVVDVLADGDLSRDRIRTQSFTEAVVRHFR